MRRLILVLFLLFSGASLMATTSVEAARLGGGKSSGMQRQSIPREAPKAPASQPQSAPSQPAGTPATQPGGMSRWLGPLAAFGAGAVLASMFGGSAFAGAMGNMLMIALVIGLVFFAINFFRRKATPAPATAGAPMQYAELRPVEPQTPINPNSPAALSMGATAAARRYPEGFDAEGFLRNAKVSFIRLQAANDANDVRDIRDYTTPELYAELAMQIQERAGKPQKTEVITLNAELLDVTQEPERLIASVRYTGLVREQEVGNPTPLDEIWHVVKDSTNAKATWLIAGIEQNG